MENIINIEKLFIANGHRQKNRFFKCPSVENYRKHQGYEALLGHKAFSMQIFIKLEWHILTTKEWKSSPMYHLLPSRYLAIFANFLTFFIIS